MNKIQSIAIRFFGLRFWVGFAAAFVYLYFFAG